MQDLLHTQRVGVRGRGSRPRPSRKHRRAPARPRRSGRVHRPVRQEPLFRSGPGRPALFGAPAAAARFAGSLLEASRFALAARCAARLAAGLFRRNRYLFVTACGLLFLAATGLIFSAVLQRSLERTPVRSAAGASEPAEPDAAGEPDVSSGALAAAYDELGAGLPAVTRALVRDRDVEYVLQEGDSLYSIGKLYVVGAQELKDFNRIADPNRLRVGSAIVIPSKENLEKFVKERETMRLASRAARAAVPAPASLLPRSVTIGARTVQDGPLLSAELKPDEPLPAEGVSYQWDLGDGSVSLAPSLTYHYVMPGTYRVSLTLRDKYGYELKSNTLSLEVGSPEGANLHRTVYLTVNAVGDVFALPAKVSQVDDFLGRTDKPVQFVEERDGSCFYRALAPGNYSLIARGGETVYKIYLFVSPFPSVQNDRFDVDWYRTQYNTGFSNCGPASVSMAVGWAKGDFVSVTAVRNYLGFQGDGGTSFPQLERALEWRGVAAREADIAGLEDVFSVIDRGEIAIILFHTAKISKVRGRADTNYVGRYYADSVGHYIIIKGYTTDRRYFVVYDPLPSDWFSNGIRYGDGLSMIGRNRCYAVAEMARALSVPKMLVVSR